MRERRRHGRGKERDERGRRQGEDGREYMIGRK